MLLAFGANDILNQRSSRGGSVKDRVLGFIVGCVLTGFMFYLRVIGDWVWAFLDETKSSTRVRVGEQS
jgi:hypothetical protein